jgi:hypothetical protein
MLDRRTESTQISLMSFMSLTHIHLVVHGDTTIMPLHFNFANCQVAKLLNEGGCLVKCVSSDKMEEELQRLGYPAIPPKSPNDLECSYCNRGFRDKHALIQHCRSKKHTWYVNTTTTVTVTAAGYTMSESDDDSDRDGGVHDGSERASDGDSNSDSADGNDLVAVHQKIKEFVSSDSAEQDTDDDSESSDSTDSVRDGMAASSRQRNFLLSSLTKSKVYVDIFSSDEEQGYCDGDNSSDDGESGSDKSNKSERNDSDSADEGLKLRMSHHSQSQSRKRKPSDSDSLLITETLSRKKGKPNC